jgi:hypothetical protein
MLEGSGLQCKIGRKTGFFRAVAALQHEFAQLVGTPPNNWAALPLRGPWLPTGDRAGITLYTDKLCGSSGPPRAIAQIRWGIAAPMEHFHESARPLVPFSGQGANLMSCMMELRGK